MSLPLEKQQNPPLNIAMFALENVLDDTYALYRATHHHYWNGSGNQSVMSHELFAEHYRREFEVLDDIAAHIENLTGHIENINFSERPDALIDKFMGLAGAVITSAKRALATLDDTSHATLTDLLVERIAIHEKQIIILKNLA